MDRTLKPKSFLTQAEKDRVSDAIEAAELKTSAEIRVVVSRTGKGDPMEGARKTFEKLRMHETTERNGVLIFLAVNARQFAIWGDAGIHAYFGQEGWDLVRDAMSERFREDDFAGGLEEGVNLVGQVLAVHFPYSEDDINELSNEVVEE